MGWKCEARRGRGEWNPSVASAERRPSKMPRRWITASCCDANHRQRDAFPWGQLLAISSCTLAWAIAIFSLSTYMGVYVQELLELPSLDMAGEGYHVPAAIVCVG